MYACTIEVHWCGGSVAEWSKALVLGTSHFDGVGSNPTAASIFILSYFDLYYILFSCRSPMLVIGRCLGAFSRAYPDPFLEKRLFGFDLESLLSQLDMASTQGSTAGNVLYVVDIVIPVLSKSVDLV